MQAISKIWRDNRPHDICIPNTSKKRHGSTNVKVHNVYHGK
jgi:hypothetical protein